MNKKIKIECKHCYGSGKINPFTHGKTFGCRRCSEKGYKEFYVDLMENCFCNCRKNKCQSLRHDNTFECLECEKIWGIDWEEGVVEGEFEGTIHECSCGHIQYISVTTYLKSDLCIISKEDIEYKGKSNE